MSEEVPPESTQARGTASKASGLLQFVQRHPKRILQAVFFSLLAIIILQNLEPTSIDVLFWSFAGLPKLVLILVSMLIGAVAWEFGSRWFRG